MAARKNKRKTTNLKANKRVDKSIFTLEAILISITVISIAFIFFNTKNLNNSPNINNQQVLPSNLIIFPNSTVGIATESENQKTYNYRAPDGVTSSEIIEFYKKEMVAGGWKLIYSDDTQALFEKGREKVRVWILYLEVRPGAVVEYIIDYTTG